VFLRLGEVEFDAARDDADLFGRLELLEKIGRVQQGFCRDAAAQQAGAAQILIFFNDRCPESHLRGTDGGHISAGAAADYHCVKYFATQ
jgi:hypothetical protein